MIWSMEWGPSALSPEGIPPAWAVKSDGREIIARTLGYARKSALASQSKQVDWLGLLLGHRKSLQDLSNNNSDYFILRQFVWCVAGSINQLLDPLYTSVSPGLTFQSLNPPNCSLGTHAPSFVLSCFNWQP